MPPEVCIPLVQGTGQPAEPCVAPGDRVRTGEPVARTAAGLVVHASISGQVMAIEARPVPAPIPAQLPCIVVRGDGLDEPFPGQEGFDSALLNPAELCDRIAAAGITGLGGALFPTADKLRAGAGSPLLILNGAECEPYISCDEALLRERAARVVRGSRILARAINAERTVVALETDMPEARSAVSRAISAAGDPALTLAVVTAKYPAGGERQLIEMLTGRQVPTGGLPIDVGCVCQNVGTAAAVAELFELGKPLISRIVTVTGGAVEAPRNIEARIGTSIRTLVELAGGYRAVPDQLIMGGPMMGYALSDDALPVTKATNCILAATAAELRSPGAELPCIRCGECSLACPARLMPQDLHNGWRARDVPALEALGTLDCIECGACDYVCPSFIPLTARLSEAKRWVRERRAADAEAQRARARHESRRARIAAEAAQRDRQLDAEAGKLPRADEPEQARAAIEALLKRVRERRTNEP